MSSQPTQQQPIQQQQQQEERSYEEAVEALNSLQSNALVLEAQRKSGGKDLDAQLPLMQENLQRVGIMLDDLDKLRIIHVTGSKGKGSSCAFTESILRHHGYKTGLFTSPHLIEVRERIRINGAPLSREQFAFYFWKCWDALKRTPDSPMPPYFRFTNIMACYIFLAESIDAAIFEVGIGGRYDSTNIVPHPIATAVTSLGLEHTALLGTTLSSIAYHKGGIIKHGAPCFTVPNDSDAASTLLSCAQSAKTTLLQVPLLTDYTVESTGLKYSRPLLGLSGYHQWSNASIAIQLSHYWLSQSSLPPGTLPTYGASDALVSAPLFPLSDTYIRALENTHWPGRCQTVKKDGITYLIDGAHTLESCEACVDWARGILSKDLSSRVVLLFNFMGDRDAHRLLTPFVRQHKNRPFAEAHFCPNQLRTLRSDMTNHMVSKEAVLNGPQQNMTVWTEEIADPTALSSVHTSINDALEAIQANAKKHAPTPTTVVVTGSLHLVGGVLTVLACPVE